MSAQPPSRKSFERSSPFPRRPLASGGAATGRRSFYGRLLEVALRNDYFPPPFAAPDFTVAPTAATVETMQQLGLLLRTSAAGFTVLYDESREERLTDFLCREVWTRLSFVLRLTDPLFCNFTQLPLDFNPSESNFYFSNQTAHRRGGVTLLNPGRHATAAEILPLVPGLLAVPVGPEVAEVRVVAISGEVVLCRPRFGQDRIYLDFSLLPDGRYTVEEVGYDGGVLRRWPVLSSSAYPVPFAFLDLLLTQPRPGEPGIYPVRGLWTRKPEVSFVDYQLVFARRSTLWRYYVVLPRDAEEPGLQIESVPPTRERFSGPVAVRLGDGTPAALFTARRPLPLQARSDVHLLLRADVGVLLDPLPVASSRQIVPAESGAALPRRSAYSDIYVYV